MCLGSGDCLSERVAGDRGTLIARRARNPLPSIRCSNYVRHFLKSSRRRVRPFEPMRELTPAFRAFDLCANTRKPPRYVARFVERAKNKVSHSHLSSLSYNSQDLTCYRAVLAQLAGQTRIMHRLERATPVRRRIYCSACSSSETKINAASVESLIVEYFRLKQFHPRPSEFPTLLSIRTTCSEVCSIIVSGRVNVMVKIMVH